MDKKAQQYVVAVVTLFGNSRTAALLPVFAMPFSGYGNSFLGLQSENVKGYPRTGRCQHRPGFDGLEDGTFFARQDCVTHHVLGEGVLTPRLTIKATAEPSGICC